MTFFAGILPGLLLLLLALFWPYVWPCLKKMVRQIDFQDVLLVLAFAGVLSGTAAIYWPAALIIGGILCFIFAALKEVARARQSRHKAKQ